MLVSHILAAVQYGPYINPFKVLPVVVILLIWAKLLTWIDKDSEVAHLPRMALNTGFVCGMFVGFLLLLIVPGFALALTVFIVAMIGEIGVYLVLRNQKVGLQDLSKQFKKWLSSFGSKKGKEVSVGAGQVMLIDKKGTPFPPPDSESPDQTAYNAAQSMFTDALRRGADRIEMKPADASAAATVRYSVDGVWIEGRSVPRDDASAAVSLLKRLAGLDINDKRKPQAGTMKTSVDGKKKEIQIQTAGSTAGESVAAEIEPKKRFELRVDQLGFMPEQLASLEDAIGEGQGIVLLGAPKASGLTSLLYGVLRRHDAFLSHIQTIEREPAVDLEGITQNKVPPGAGEEYKQVTWVASQEPDVLMVDKVEDPKSAAELIKFAATGRRVYVGSRTGGVFESMQAWRTLVGDDKAAMKQLKLIVVGRLLRKLCTACKMDYNPDPDTLRKLNMPPEKVGKLFTARNTPLRDNRGREMVCEFCLDLHFKGRIGVYEMFQVDDEVRQVVQAGGSINQLKMLFKKQRQKYLQELALARAVAGDTSLQEIARVLRASETPSSSSSSSSAKRAK